MVAPVVHAVPEQPVPRSSSGGRGRPKGSKNKSKKIPRSAAVADSSSESSVNRSMTSSNMTGVSPILSLSNADAAIVENRANCSMVLQHRAMLIKHYGDCEFTETLFLQFKDNVLSLSKQDFVAMHGQYIDHLCKNSDLFLEHAAENYRMQESKDYLDSFSNVDVICIIARLCKTDSHKTGFKQTFLKDRMLERIEAVPDHELGSIKEYYSPMTTLLVEKAVNLVV